MTVSFRPGDLLDHFRLNCLVARSGMVSVFRATDTQTGDSVAIKIPHLQNRRGWRRNRFDREAKLLRRFDHPGIVRMLPSSRGTCSYTVMEWIEGRLLREIMHERRELSIGRAVRIALQICDVLVYIHERGIVHLDLKPENIIVDGDDQIQLIDFDLACEAKPGLWAMLRLKRMGTPDYASPEQIQGKPTSVRSDVYSFGVLLYEMLTGQVPFSGVAPVTALNLRLRADPMPLSEMNPDVPQELDALVCRALARDPVQRPPTARALRFELDHIHERCARELVGSV